MALSCPKVQLTESFLPPILLNVSEYSHTLRGENMAGETRQKILDATEKLLLLKGLARVTTKEIARETGLAEGALYRHFEHKKEQRKHDECNISVSKKASTGSGIGDGVCGRGPG